ncbi:Serine hydrolase FSH [Penicillium bovifimosum]|uniref:Serine hydrolase FSH n=1 Tax=Penicillium bovifimosum TaxID=126998 RepID=A0A9W9HFU0_9EURO|nr:Serine hydrolase FSH [Penicillium bovifimosum]KAJ5145789.1 Serine hydrolase FSH [Penicillium bovifimosum]
MKILMIHGSRQSGELFRAKLQALEKMIQRAFGSPQLPGAEFVYPTAPFSLGSPTGTSELRNRHGAWTWFHSDSIDGLYPELEGGLDSIGSVLKDSGPFDGVVGFSEGAAAAGMVASLLEENRKDAFAQLEAEGGIPYPASFATLDHPPSNLWSAFRDMPPHTRLIAPSTIPPFGRRRCTFWEAWIVSLMKMHQ